MAAWNYPGQTKRSEQRSACAGSRRRLRTSRHLEWTVFTLFLLDCCLQVMAGFAVVGSFFYLINFLVDLLIFGLLFLMLITRG